LRVWEFVAVDSLVLPVGLTAILLVVVRFGLFTLSGVWQLGNQRRTDGLSLRLLEGRIESAAKQRALNTVAWNGYRKFVIDRRVEEADGVCSFYLVPHDGKPLPLFRPGQYLTFSLNVPGREKPIIRCYSHSAGPRTDYYRITVKRVHSPSATPAAPPGLVSNYFHEQLSAGDIIDVQASRGSFFLAEEAERPAVLIAGGVGITPLLSMIESVVDRRSSRELMLFYGVREGSEHAFRDDLAGVAEEHANIRLIVAYSQPTAMDESVEGRAYQHDGRITAELLRSYLQSTNYEFYICGPADMMDSLTTQLTQWGVAKKDVKTEAFGPAAVKTSPAAQQTQRASNKRADKGDVKSSAKAAAPACRVTFARTDVSHPWTADCGSLLDLAANHRVSIESGCRAGSCGTCVVAIKSGKVSYLTEHDAELEDGTCLACIAIPDGDVVLDA
jgi:ferredoxin-NADP reductase/ferredoxin